MSFPMFGAYGADRLLYDPFHGKDADHKPKVRSAREIFTRPYMSKHDGSNNGMEKSKNNIHSLNVDILLWKYDEKNR